MARTGQDVKQTWNRTQRHWDDRAVFHQPNHTPLMRLRWKITSEKAAEAVHSLFRRERRLLDVLDIGCGRGEFYPAVAPWVKRYVGLEPSDHMIPKGERRGDGAILLRQGFGGQGGRRGENTIVRFVRGEAEKMPASLKNFDAAVFKESLDHCWDHRKALCNTWKALKNGGLLIVTLNNRSSYYKRLFKDTAAQAENAHQDHFVFFDPASLTSRLEETGFTDVRWQTYHYLKMPAVLERVLGEVFPELFWRLKFFTTDALFRMFMPRSGGAMIVTAVKRDKGRV